MQTLNIDVIEERNFRLCMERNEDRKVIVYNILTPSLQMLYELDYYNICAGASERNICARLAHHMENNMRDYTENSNNRLFYQYSVDVEYNRMGYDCPKYYEENKGQLRYMVSDLLIHSRGRAANMLAIELKRKENHRKIDSDIRRLKSLVSSRLKSSESECVYGTLVGAFITYSTKRVMIEIFEDVNGSGDKTGEIGFVVNADGIRHATLDMVKDTWNNRQ